MNIEHAMMVIPADWFIYHLGEHVRPIRFVGDRHDFLGVWACELQHRDGGMLTKAEGATAADAVLAAIRAVS